MSEIRTPRWVAAAASFGAGAVGVVALAPRSVALFRQALIRAGEPVPPDALLAALAVAQPLLLLALASWIGASLATPLGLRSRLAEWPTRGRRAWAGFQRDLPWALGSGACAAALLAAVDLAAIRAGAIGWEASVLAPRDAATVAIAALYGGLTEEVMMRWGAMTLVAWLAHRGGLPRTASMVIAIVASSILFGLGHLPAASAGEDPLPFDAGARIVVLNGVGGLFFGWLYWRHTLEAAMTAHAFAHVAWAVGSALAAR